MKRLIIIIIAAALIGIMLALVIPSEPIPEPQAEPKVITPPMLVTIIPHNPTVCEFLSVEVQFDDGESMDLRSFDYNITAVQNDDVIISESGVHKHPGKHQIHESTILLGVMPIEITVTTDGVADTALTIIPETAINIDCEELHDTKDILP